MSRWHTDRQDPAQQEHGPTLSPPAGRLAKVTGRQALALGLSRQSRLVWLLAFALAVFAHLIMTLWLMVTVAPQTGTQEPVAVSMLFEAPPVPLSASSQSREQNNPAPQPQVQPELAMKNMPDMNDPALEKDMEAVPPPPVLPEAEQSLAAPALPKKMVMPDRPIQHDGKRSMSAKHVPEAEAATGAVASASVKTTSAASGGQAATPPSVPSAGRTGSMQLTCSAPEAHYPVSARHLHEEGEAVAEVSLNSKGQVVAARLVKSTGYDDLDDQALQTVKNLHCTAPGSAAVTGRIPVGFHIQ
ncbi:TonB family protein [Acetobacter syzygii]|uniref:energy transducer TonB n=1 Tax=Acetobacter syzygii TaxID=146476 RepID=UPI0039EA9783